MTGGAGSEPCIASIGSHAGKEPEAVQTVRWRAVSWQLQ